ncbi:aspartic peptidase domain-containing protein [Colletotrichum cereale]|nr:aspartic peptidase domain-containing protein [Colletotrichum cereale]
MKLEPSLGSSRDIRVKATLVAATNWTSGAPLNETNYKPPVGILGLGPARPERIDGTTDPSILEQLQTSGDIERNAFSVHMGSAALKLPGSLVLGGYEQNRALGQVGTFALMESSVPVMYLRDLFMDSTEQGKQITKNVGGPAGSVFVIPNPASPYIYLPSGFCEGIATNLHMTLHKATGLYLWGSDPRAEIFVNSSAYLGFVLSDQSGTNLTIKVPFKLLNLTLEPPLVEQPVNYFPCKSLDSAWGFWQLGRAFLQAAFLAVDYDGDVAYMAQAPGPDIEQSVMRKFDDSMITTNPEESFLSTWRSSWKPVNISRTPDTGDTGLHSIGRGKTGMAVGVVVAICAALWF